jgi:hypothetical protein
MSSEDLDIRLRLAAQVGLLGQITRSLLQVSVELAGTTVRFRCIFDGAPSEDDVELLSEAATNVIAAFPAPYDIDEEYLAAGPGRMDHLKYIVYRYIPPPAP